MRAHKTTVFVELEKPRGPRERLISLLLGLCALVPVAVTLALVALLVAGARDHLTTDFLAPLLGGTFLTAGIAILVAVPLGLAAAIYLAELAPERWRRVLKPVLELLAGIPTVVHGYVALVWITPALGLATYNALAPGLVLGVMILPVVTSLAEDAIHAVPAELKEGALALGGGNLASIFRVVLPPAYTGIAAAALVGLARAVGETMILAIAAGHTARLTLDPREPIQTLASSIVDSGAGAHAAGLALFILTLGIHALSRLLRRRRPA